MMICLNKAARATHPAARRPRPAVLLGLLALAAALLNAGCTSPIAPFWSQQDTPRPTPSDDWQEIAPNRALVSLTTASAPQIVAVRERHVTETLLLQDIVFANDTNLPGENSLRLAVAFEPGLSWSLTDTRSHERVQDILRQREAFSTPENLATLFGDLPYEVSPYLPENMYGIYGIAQTPSGVEPSCLVAWQKIDDQEKILPETIKSLYLSLRFCRQKQTRHAIRHLFESVTLSPATGVLSTAAPISSHQWSPAPIKSAQDARFAGIGASDLRPISECVRPLPESTPLSKAVTRQPGTSPELSSDKSPIPGTLYRPGWTKHVSQHQDVE